MESFGFGLLADYDDVRFFETREMKSRPQLKRDTHPLETLHIAAFRRTIGRVRDRTYRSEEFRTGIEGTFPIVLST